jgi:hypothetical protein
MSGTVTEVTHKRVTQVTRYGLTVQETEVQQEQKNNCHTLRSVPWTVAAQPPSE